MTEEIELILYKLEQNYKCDKEQYFVLYKPDIKQILDYITNLQQENEDFKTIIKQYVDIVLHDRKIIDNYKSRCKKANDFIDNYDVFKEFSFPLMKRDIENQIKSSIDYEFNSTFRKKLKNILNGSDENE